MSETTEATEWGQGYTDLGYFLVARVGESISWLSLGEDPDALRTEFFNNYGAHIPPKACDPAAPWMQHICAVLNDDAPSEELSVILQGTPFQCTVWRALRGIPRGQTRTYQEVAKAIGQPTAARAVGAAIGKNRIAVLIPCHRVLRKDGGVSGFRWGVARKKRLLQRESAQQTLGLE